MNTINFNGDFLTRDTKQGLYAWWKDLFMRQWQKQKIVRQFKYY